MGSRPFTRNCVGILSGKYHFLIKESCAINSILSNVRFISSLIKMLTYFASGFEKTCCSLSNHLHFPISAQSKNIKTAFGPNYFDLFDFWEHFIESKLLFCLPLALKSEILLSYFFRDIAATISPFDHSSLLSWQII